MPNFSSTQSAEGESEEESDPDTRQTMSFNSPRPSSAPSLHGRSRFGAAAAAMAGARGPSRDPVEDSATCDDADVLIELHQTCEFSVRMANRFAGQPLLFLDPVGVSRYWRYLHMLEQRRADFTAWYSKLDRETFDRCYPRIVLVWYQLESTIQMAQEALAEERASRDAPPLNVDVSPSSTVSPASLTVTSRSSHPQPSNSVQSADAESECTDEDVSSSVSSASEDSSLSSPVPLRAVLPPAPLALPGSVSPLSPLDGGLAPTSSRNTRHDEARQAPDVTSRLHTPVSESAVLHEEKLAAWVDQVRLRFRHIPASLLDADLLACDTTLHDLSETLLAEVKRRSSKLQQRLSDPSASHVSPHRLGELQGLQEELDKVKSRLSTVLAESDDTLSPLRIASATMTAAEASLGLSTASSFDASASDA